MPISLAHPGDIITVDLYKNDNVVLFTSKVTRNLAFIFDPTDSFVPADGDPMPTYTTIESAF